MPMRPLALAAALALAGPLAAAQSLELVGTVQFETTPFPTNGAPVGGSDVWGYTAPDGAEYAIMGVLDGVAVVAVPSLEVVARVPGPTFSDPYYHRDIVTHGEYAYVVSENLGTSEGLQILDLRGLPDAVTEAAVYRGRVVSSHNLDIDAETGVAYVLDSRADGVAILDLAVPDAPVELGYIGLPDAHDVHARGDTLWIAEGRSPTFSVWDTRDRANPTMLARVTIPDAGYVHNVWPTDDGRYAVTTEETRNKTVKVWDLADMSAPELVGEWLGASALAHNAHVQGEHAFVSHYTSGMHVVSLADPAAPSEVARYDTYPANDAAGFFGNWGMTTPSPGGYVYGSDLEGALTVLRWRDGAVAGEPAPGAEPEAAAELRVGPNPARGAAAVRVALDAPAHVRVAVVDALGREALVAYDAPAAGGELRVALDLGALPPGVYRVRADADGRTATRALTVVR